MNDLTIIGGGPAGVAGAVYAARKELQTLFITKDFEGQSAVSSDIHNWIGTPSISGADLAKNLEAHARSYEGKTLTIKTGDIVTKVESMEGGFRVTGTAETFESKAVLVTSGGRRRRLNVPGADTFEHKGLTYCATCDGPLFAGKDVVVVGGGNAGFEAAAQLLAYCHSVTLLHRHPTFKADSIIIEALKQNPAFTAIPNAEPTAVTGDTFVTALTYRDIGTGASHELPVSGIFVEIGFEPNTDFIRDLVACNQFGAIIVDPATQRTNVPGIWAAGDCTDARYHQNNIAAGDAVKAIEDLFGYLRTRA